MDQQGYHLDFKLKLDKKIKKNLQMGFTSQPQLHYYPFVLRLFPSHTHTNFSSQPLRPFIFHVLSISFVPLSIPLDSSQSGKRSGRPFPSPKAQNQSEYQNVSVLKTPQTAAFSCYYRPDSLDTGVKYCLESMRMKIIATQDKDK